MTLFYRRLLTYCAVAGISGLSTFLLTLLIFTATGCNRPTATGQDAETAVPSVAFNQDSTGQSLAEDSLVPRRPRLPVDKVSWLRRVLAGRPAPPQTVVINVPSSAAAKNIKIGRGSQVTINNGNNNQSTQASIKKNKAPSQQATTGSQQTAATGGGDVAAANGANSKVDLKKEIPVVAKLTFWQRLTEGITNFTSRFIGYLSIGFVIAIIGLILWVIFQKKVTDIF